MHQGLTGLVCKTFSYLSQVLETVERFAAHFSNVMCWSNHTPRFRRDVTGLIIASPTVTLSILILANCLREPMIINSVLESLMKSRFDTIHLRKSAIHFSIGINCICL